MSRFKIISNSNINVIRENNSQLHKLRSKALNDKNLSHRKMVEYAYAFLELGDFLSAQKYLNMIPEQYFWSEIYKDLYQAMLAWSIIKIKSDYRNEKLTRSYEYFILLRKAINRFSELNFKSKVAFQNFKREFEVYSNFTNLI